MELFEIDWRSPLDAFAPLAQEPFAALLHAGDGALDPGFSIATAFPVARLTSREGRAEFDGARSALTPFAALRALLGARRTGARPHFSSGLIGFAGYELGALLEPSAAGPPSPYRLPDMGFGAYDAAALFDRRGRRAFIAARSAYARDRLAEALGREDADGGKAAPSGATLQRRAEDEAHHQARVAAAIERIRDGDFFQANLAQVLELRAPSAIDAYGAFRALAKGDAPFGAYLRHEDGAIVSASPERFFKIEPDGAGARILAEPIKGTRPRGKTHDADMAMARALVESAKDRAENVMIADLLRNDLARVCRDGSIVEEAICELRSFSSVHHLVSAISGRLAEGKTAVDAFEALFPCGSITGAPKIEATRAIGALEGRGRGPYCGAIGYFDDGGGADFAVAIRTMIIEGERAFAPVGGGVTLRSDPRAEYAETLDKAVVMLNALGVAP
jgi:para-aminobenzoate synthetase component 1